MEAVARRTTFRETDKPKCCGREMWLLRIEPLLAADRCTFECARCGAQEVREVAPGGSMAKIRA